MRQILTFTLALFLLVLSATPGLTHRSGDRGASNIAPGTRFGRTPMARQPYPYLYPVNPELWRQEQRERRENEVPADKPPQAQPENEPPVRKRPPVKPKFIQVR